MYQGNKHLLARHENMEFELRVKNLEENFGGHLRASHRQDCPEHVKTRDSRGL